MFPTYYKFFLACVSTTHLVSFKVWQIKGFIHCFLPVKFVSLKVSKDFKAVEALKWTPGQIVIWGPVVQVPPCKSSLLLKFHFGLCAQWGLNWSKSSKKHWAVLATIEYSEEFFNRFKVSHLTSVSRYEG